MVGNTLLWMFSLPGNMVSDALYARQADGRVVPRTLINILVLNFAATMVAYVWQR